jgi:hypothetical protein
MHTLSVKKGLIPSLFADIDMYPSFTVDRVDFGPDMVFGIPDPSDSCPDGSAEHAEAVGPFATSAAAGLQEHKGIVVSRVSLVSTAVVEGALVQLDLIGTAGLLVR